MSPMFFLPPWRLDELAKGLNLTRDEARLCVRDGRFCFGPVEMLVAKAIKGNRVSGCQNADVEFEGRRLEVRGLTSCVHFAGSGNYGKGRKAHDGCVYEKLSGLCAFLIVDLWEDSLPVYLLSDTLIRGLVMQGRIPKTGSMGRNPFYRLIGAL